MDNPSRSERTRKAVLDAALTVIARDGAHRLTLDAIARESGVSKGGLMHQFRNKEAVLKALLDAQTKHFREFSRRYADAGGEGGAPSQLEIQIATLREAVTTPRSAAFAILGVLGQDPRLLAGLRAVDRKIVATIKAEAADPELALLRWSAARGLVTTAVLGMCPLTAAERGKLFARLLQEVQRASAPAAGKRRAVRASAASSSAARPAAARPRKTR